MLLTFQNMSTTTTALRIDQASECIIPPHRHKSRPTHRRRGTTTIRVSNDERADGAGRKANLVAARRERTRLPVYLDGDGNNILISEFLSQPSGIEAMLYSRSLQNLQPLGSDTFRCTLQTISILSFEVVPVIDLRLVYTRNGCTVQMLSCKFEGSEALRQQNDLFSAFMSNAITWEESCSEPFLDFDVRLEVTLQVYTMPFTMLPLSAVEAPGNVIMQGIIDRLVPLSLEQFLEDYKVWATESGIKRTRS